MKLLDLGHMPYLRALERQIATVNEVKAGGKDTLIFVEHDPVLTLGASFHGENLLLSTGEYETQGFEIVRNDRGGDVTYHGPGQLVIYPIFDVSRHGKDLHKWLRDLEETMLVTLSEFGVKGRRFPPHTGAWIGDKKVAAIGIKISRWVSMHGIALNCDNDLAPFQTIVPCGIVDYGVTSLTEAAGRRVTIEDAKPIVTRAFAEVFGSGEA